MRGYGHWRTGRGRIGHGRQQGLSLLELMVAMVLGGIVMATALSALFVGKSNFILASQLAILQENARFAIQHLSQEIRMAGFNACRRRPLQYANVLHEANNHWYLENTGIGGFEHEEGINSYPAPFADDVRDNTDVLIVRRADNMGYYSAGHDPAAARFMLNRPHDLESGQVMLVASADCAQLGLFQVSATTANNMAIEHAVNNNSGQGNCSRVLSGNFDCSNAPAAQEQGAAYPDGSRLMRFESRAYYIGSSSTDNNMPALFQRVMRHTASGLSTVSEELLQGVENMQLLYGVDSQGADGRVDSYQTANIVHNADAWNEVLSVHVVLRMRSIHPVYAEDVAYGKFQGINGTEGRDRFLRKVVSTTIKIRN